MRTVVRLCVPKRNETANELIELVRTLPETHFDVIIEGEMPKNVHPLNEKDNVDMSCPALLVGTGINTYNCLTIPSIKHAITLLKSWKRG